jgi:hypothetical protein
VRPLGRKALTSLLVLAAAFAVVSLWRARQQRDVTRPPTPGETAADEIDRLKDERDLLRGQVRHLGAQLAETNARQTAVTESNVAETSNAEPARAANRPRPTREQEMAWLMARAHFLDDVLDKQPRNDTWATTVEKKARVLAEGRAKDGVKLVNVTCRSTACRMEYVYPDAAARVRHIESLGEDFTELPRVSYAYPGEPDVQTRAIMHLATSDQPLPTLDYKTFAAQQTP